MARQIQIRRGTAEEHANFTGAIGEVTMDTDLNTLRVHDGETVGGTLLAKKSEVPDLANMDYVIESQLPTPSNNYTWYRKYKSGWIEQGGLTPNDTSSVTVTFAKEMKNTNYSATAVAYRESPGHNGATSAGMCIGSFTTTGMYMLLENSSRRYMWTIRGESA